MHQEVHIVSVNIDPHHVIVACGEHLDYYDEWPNTCVHCGETV